MPKYNDNILNDLKAKQRGLEKSIEITPVKWAYAKALDSAKTQLALAKLGIHRIQSNQCNCGLIVERSIRFGHRDHKTKVPTNNIELVIDLEAGS